MSDRPLGQDWWLASDGKWYPPQSRTEQPPPPPATPDAAPSTTRQYVSYGLTGTLMGFFIAAAAFAVLGSVLYFATWSSWLDFDEGNSGFRDIRGLEEAGDVLIGLVGLCSIVLTVLVIIWTYMSYNAAASRGAEGRRWSSGWAVGGWFIPIAFFVIPKLVINEIDRMSNQQLDEPVGESWRSMKRTKISDWWWAFWIAGTVGTVIGDLVMLDQPDTLRFEHRWISAVAYALTAAAAVLGGIAVLRIGKRLRR